MELKISIVHVLYIYTFQVVFYLYLWSTDMEAILVAMSCFSLLCQEAEIRYANDDTTKELYTPNAPVYNELAQVAIEVTTGKLILVVFRSM